MITLFSDYGKIFEVKQDHFPDNTLHVSFPDEYINAIEWKYENDAELFTLICARRHYAECDMRLILPYIPHARMDRVKDETDVFTLKYFCEIINSLNFAEVWVLDPHSNVSLALLDRVSQTPVIHTIHECLNRLVYEIGHDCDHETREKVYQDLVLFFPDEGSMKRYSSEVDFLPYAFGIKKRDWKTGQIQGLQLMNGELVKDKNVLIIDDICSRGGTFYHAAKALKEAGAANVYLYVTHAENTMIKGDMYNDPDLIKKIYTVETIFDSNLDTLHKVDVIQNW